MQLFYAKNVTGNAALVVTANLGQAQTYSAIFVWDIAGADLTSPLDAQAVNYTVSVVSTISTVAFSTIAPDEIIVSMATDGAINDTFSATGSPLAIFDANFPAGAGNLYCGAQHLIVSSIQTSITQSMQQSGSGGMLIVAASFKAAAASGFVPQVGAFIVGP